MGKETSIVGTHDSSMFTMPVAVVGPHFDWQVMVYFH